MSLDTLDQQITGYRAQAANAIDSYLTTQSEVARDPNLSDIGKRDTLTPLHDQTTTKVQALLEKEKTAIRQKREALEKSLFGISAGNSSDVVSYRDAQDRAARITDYQDAHTVYTNALRSDDKVLAQAIIAQALTYNWTDIVADYRNRNPSAATALDDLGQLGRYEANGLLALLNYVVPPLDLGGRRPVPVRAASDIGGMR